MRFAPSLSENKTAGTTSNGTCQGWDTSLGELFHEEQERLALTHRFPYLLHAAPATHQLNLLLRAGTHILFFPVPTLLHKFFIREENAVRDNCLNTECTGIS